MKITTIASQNSAYLVELVLNKDYKFQCTFRHAGLKKT
jgi:hypothetical protein